MRETGIVSAISRRVLEWNGQAVVGCLVGLFGLVAFGIVLGPTAVVLGLLARSRIAETGEPGRAAAWSAIVIGAAAFTVPVVLAAR
ncbi:MAG: DUF4190 domain-containing protein [Acidimicrobiia bacterium]|nr:DUF4190 domain-containing protein [Acidimicrobiia bacterium]